MNLVFLEREKVSFSLNSFKTCGYFGGYSVLGRFDCFGILGLITEIT